MKKVLLTAAVYLLPTLALAQGYAPQSVDVSGLTGTVRGLTAVVNYAIPFFLAIAIIAFIIGVIRYLFAGGAEEKQKAREFLLWGVISITVILAVFGIARLLINLFGLNPTQLNNNEIPTVGTNPPIP